MHMSFGYLLGLTICKVGAHISSSWSLTDLCKLSEGEKMH